MVTIVGTEADVVELLKGLIKLELDAADAYRAAINRLNRPDADQLRLFLADHERHAGDLAPFVPELRGTPQPEGGAKSLLTTDKVAIANLTGEQAILRAMRANEDDITAAYERAIERKDLAPAIRDALQGNLADEPRHRTWIEENLSRE